MLKKCSYSVNLVQDLFFKPLITSLLGHLFRGRQGSPIWIEKKSFVSQRTVTDGSEKQMIFERAHVHGPFQRKGNQRGLFSNNHSAAQKKPM
jgi:hypothetical protein